MSGKAAMSDPLADLIAAEHLPETYREVVSNYWEPLAGEIASRAAGAAPLIVGINGAQGSGKSTVCRFLEVLLRARGLRAVTLALDDLYLSQPERKVLARQIHPLFATRGVPGTHAAGVGMAIVEAVRAGRSFTLPRFDKARDDRAEQGEAFAGPIDVLLFEGWCVGAIAQGGPALLKPVNALESEQDAAATWRGLVNRFLARDYARLFGEIDLLVMLKIESFDRVIINRSLQEAKLRAANPDAPGLMDKAALVQFVAHYERLTRWMLEEMPGRADICIDIGPDQAPVAMRKQARRDGLGGDRRIL